MNLLNPKSRFLFATHLAFVAVFAIIFFGLTITPTNAATEWYIKDDATGGDCSSVGAWDAQTKTCVLSQDLTKGVVIESDDITLDGNNHTIVGIGPGNGVYALGKSRLVIKELSVSNFAYGINLCSVNNSTVAHNTVSNNDTFGIAFNPRAGENSCYIGSSNNNVVEDNTLSTQRRHISVGAGSNNVIRNNTIQGGGTGIDLWYTDASNIVGNKLKNVSDGIAISYARDNLIANNNIENDNLIELPWMGGRGIAIYGDSYSQSNEVVENRIVKYSSEIFLRGNVNKIYNNTLEDGHLGLVLFYGTGNEIYNNNFVNHISYYGNRYVLIDFGITGNKFSLPAPIGGNYWSDFDTPDEGCNNIDNNNFCDTPYVFTGLSDDGHDDLPWTKKDGWLAPTNTLPTLSYSQNTGYIDDGISPDEGDTETAFTFKIVYTDPDNDPPTDIRTIVFAGDSSTATEDTPEPEFSSDIMVLDTSADAQLRDGNYANGEQYALVKSFPTGTYRYRFQATDGKGLSPILDGIAGGKAQRFEVTESETPINPEPPVYEIPPAVKTAENHYYDTVRNALEETTLIYSEMVADTAVDTAYILIDKYLEDAFDKLFKVDETTPLRERTKKDSMKAFAELTTDELKNLAPDPTSITTSVVATAMREVFLVDINSPAPHPKFYKITESGHLEFIETKLANNPADDSIDVYVGRLDALRALAEHTADDVKTFKIGTFDVIEKLQEANKKAKFYLKLGGAVFLGKAIVVPISAPINLPVGTSMLSVSTGLDVLGLTSEVGEWFMLMHIFGDVYLSELQTVRLYTTGLEGTIGTLNTGEFPQVGGAITTLIVPQEIALNDIGSFGGGFKNTGDVTIDGRLVISITDPYGEVRKYTTDTKRIPPQNEISLTTDIPFHGTPLIIGGGTGEHSVTVQAEYGVLGFEKSSEMLAKTFDVVYEPSPFVKTIIDNIKPFGELIVGIQLTNNGKESKTYTIVDEIPKEIAADLTNVQFSRQPDEILNPDPVVAWHVYLAPGESITLQYKITNLSQGLENELSYPHATLAENGNIKDSVQVVLDNNSARDLGGDSLGMLLGQISSLPDSAFGDRPKQKRDALISKTKEVIKKVESAEFTDAVNKLARDIRPKIDGQPSPQDWVSDENARTLLLRLVDDAIGLVGLLR